MLKVSGIETAGKHAVVIGRSDIVGRPMAALLSQKGADATVTLCHSRTRDIGGYCRSADILVAAIGIHIFSAFYTWYKSKKARKHQYAVKKSAVDAYAARTMRITGVLLIFLIFPASPRLRNRLIERYFYLVTVIGLAALFARVMIVRRLMDTATNSSPVRVAAMPPIRM